MDLYDFQKEYKTEDIAENNFREGVLKLLETGTPYTNAETGKVMGHINSLENNWSDITVTSQLYLNRNLSDDKLILIHINYLGQEVFNCVLYDKNMVVNNL